ncbi:hypothetical protein [Gordonia malaquae]|uniref:hypothetical protein n=1 Tax=Gordonia malaquae TaxID=410332 RepID=UPI0030FED39C
MSTQAIRNVEARRVRLEVTERAFARARVLAKRVLTEIAPALSIVARWAEEAVVDVGTV